MGIPGPQAAGKGMALPMFGGGLPQASASQTRLQAPASDLFASNSGNTNALNPSREGGGAMPTFGGTSIAGSQLDMLG